MRVLVVSEEPTVRLRATSALALHTGAEVTELASGEEARARLRSGDLAPDVLVLDGDLQPRGGFALLYDLREQAALRGEVVPPTIVLLAREQDRFLADWSAADATVAKPVDPFVLARTVGELTGSAVGAPAAETDEA
ncbi:response regulator transcription factor [Nitriliruptoraceae bacterium ZYF776]|nr:response regulator transcription factor [Profundirhabdus halotolerans]